MITYLPSYVFPKSERCVVDHMVLGVSLGGHAAWHCVFHEPAVTAAIIVIGCPDYASLMADRARLSKMLSWTGSDPPPSLMEAVERYDPAGMLLGPLRSRTSETYQRYPSPEQTVRLKPILRRLQGKRILNMGGGSDKLVPYRCGEPFLRWLKVMIADTDMLGPDSCALEDLVFEGVGHKMSPEMAEEATRFIIQNMAVRNQSISSPKI